MAKSPREIQSWLDGNGHRLDLPSQYIGTEPNAERRPWDTATVRWCLTASWPYEAAAGNQSIPAVYKAIHDHDPTFLCDRFYLPATPGDLRLLEKNGLGAFGIESKHPLTDFDIVGTSISYPVLSMSFLKLLTMSGITPRWRDRDADTSPMVMVGGLSYGAPEVLAPVVDCWFLGEVEDEPGNPGIGAVTRRVAAFKQQGRWTTDRIGCYADLAREFNFLYFPRFVNVTYTYENRNPHIGPRMSKQVVSYTSALEGMRLPLLKRHVKNLDAIKPLDNPPLLYADASMGSGDAEVGRGCPAWCSFPLTGVEEFITREGVRRLEEEVGREFEVYTPTGWQKGTVESHGVQEVQKVVFRPANRATKNGAWRATRSSMRAVVEATPTHGWILTDGTTTHNLRVGEFVRANIAEPAGELDAEGYAHGFLFGDGHQRHIATGEDRPIESGSFTVRLHGTKSDVLPWFEQLPRESVRGRGVRQHDLAVASISRPGWAGGELVVQGWAAFNVKTWPAEHADAAYLRSFLAGWLRADASPRANNTSWQLACQYNPDHGDVTALQWLQRNAAAAGWLLLGHSVNDRPTNYGPRSAPLYTFSLTQRDDFCGWKVESITSLSERKEVYCLTVPGAHQFGLASGIASGNCSLSWKTKPYRQRSIPYIREYAKNLQANMGSTRIAPFSPDLPMYSQRKALIADLLENVSDEVDAPSMRVDDFNADETFVLLQVHGGMDSVSLGVEGNSQRLRDLIGKGTSDADVKEAVARGIRAGIRKFKLYMISNLPGEDEGDVYRILRLARDLADIRDSMNQSSVRIQFSWTPLIIEGNTPMQWFAPQPASRILGDVWEEFRDLKIDSKLGAKALRLSALVLTPAGFIPMRDVRVGTQLADPEGMCSEVTGVYPQGTKPIYKLRFNDGSEVEASGDHLWTIGRWFGRKTPEGVNQAFRKRETVSTVRLAELLAGGQYPPHLVGSEGLAHFDIAEAALPVDPYVLGLLLGDGTLTKGTPRFTTLDPELVEAIQKCAPGVQVRACPDGKNYVLSTGGHRGKPNSLASALKTLGVWEHRAWQKFVPDSYKNASAKTRLAVLQGLMDTDGHGRDRRSSSFTSTSERLRDDVVWLARSLGLVAKPLSPKATSCKGKAGRTAYQALIWERDDVRVFRLSRKLLPLGRPKFRVLQSVEYVGDEECQCITVSAPSKLFVTNDFVPTHNSEPNKIAFFQLCQRASRDVGEALVDAMLEVDQACWGGVPRTFEALIESKLHAWGFQNGFADCFDERQKNDMFGWEFIDTGVSSELMWRAYVQMREFAELTDSHTYDMNFDSTYHGSEFIARCDERCQGRSCGACDYTDLQHRVGYLRAEDRDVDLTTLKPVDQHSQAVRIRARITRPSSLRFVGNDHWRFLFRRACFRATDKLGTAIAKRSIRFASDEVKYRDWTHGTDYVEFAFTRPLSDDQIAEFLFEAGQHTVDRLDIGQWRRHPTDAVTIRHDVGSIYFSVELDEQLGTIEDRLSTWRHGTTPIPMRLKVEGGYFAPTNEMVNARDYVDDLWIKTDGHRLHLRMLVKGRPNPYNIVAALMGKQSWLPYAGHHAERIEVFTHTDRHQQDFLRPTCRTCGLGIPITLLDIPFNPDHCPRCIDENETATNAASAPVR